MKKTLASLLRCPKSGDALLIDSSQSYVNEILEGSLVSNTGAFPIRNGIPRFVDDDGYAENFGLQWNTFRSTQLDSVVGKPISEERFWTSCKWDRENLKGKNVLEIGSGAGRFTEVNEKTGAFVVSCDCSCAIDANKKNNSKYESVEFVQADLYELPFEKESFDYVICYGVLQHTPCPEEALHSVVSYCKPGGRASVDFYRSFSLPTAWSTPKNLWRPITKRLPPTVLLQIVSAYVPYYLPFDTAIRKLGPFGTVLLGMIPIPCWNHCNLGLTNKQRKEWAIMDTFDALGARYDRQFSLQEIQDIATGIPGFCATAFYGGQGIICNFIPK